MLKTLRREWTRLKSSPHGKRFQRQFWRTRARRKRGNAGQVGTAPRVVHIVAAFVLLAIGFGVILFPMIYISFFVASGALFASESLSVARMLDRAEAFFWAATARPVRVIAVVLGLVCLVFTSCVCYNAFVR
jgi:hypothetical protein